MKKTWANLEVRSLQDIDGSDWGEPEFDSYVVRTVHALRKKPIGSLTDEELRLAIGQNVGLDYLVPIALTRLEQDPLAGGDFYEGALAIQLLRLPREFWAKHRALRKPMARIAEILRSEQMRERADPSIEPAAETFLSLRADRG